MSRSSVILATALGYFAPKVSIQLVGRKSFAVAEPSALKFPVGFQFGPAIPAAAELYPQAADGFSQAEDAVFTDVDLVPGSVLVLPRGHWHHTQADEVSVSLSIIANPPTQLDWALGVLRHRGLQDPDLRRPLYGGPGCAERAYCARSLSVLATALAQPGEEEGWSEATTVQAITSITVEPGNSPQLYNHYDRTLRPLELPPQAEAVLGWCGNRGGAFTVAQARAALGMDVAEGLQALVRAVVLYR